MPDRVAQGDHFAAEMGHLSEPDAETRSNEGDAPMVVILKEEPRRQPGRRRLTIDPNDPLREMKERVRFLDREASCLRRRVKEIEAKLKAEAPVS
jgi:hypothetical protein